MRLHDVRLARCAPQRPVRPHSHPHDEIVCFLEGRGSSFTGDRRTPVREGDVFVYRAGEAHDQVNDTELVSICIEMDAPGLAPLSGLWHDTTGLLAPACRRLLAEWKSPELGAGELCTGLGHEVLGLLMRGAGHARGVDRRAPDLGKALALISAREGRIGVAELASEMEITPKRLRALFQARLKTSPLNFLIHQRLECAKPLLTRGAEPLAMVAEQAGFEDAFYFSRLFKKYTGLTPGAYRKRYAREK